MAYDILVVSSNLSAPGRHVLEFFNADHVAEIALLDDALTQKNYRAVILDAINQPAEDLAVCERLFACHALRAVPVVLLSSHYSLQDKIKAFELGCDDFIDAATPGDEICARITKSVFHKIANAQLSQRSQAIVAKGLGARDSAGAAETLIQFLLQVHQCDNLDQLGQQFFMVVEGFGLSCSLQMRGVTGVKDMEAHGMAKDLESQLLMQLKDEGQFVEFGQRIIINYERVSLLIRNMPEEGSEQYGAIKNNVLCMIQGVNARMGALEHELLHRQSHQSLQTLARLSRQSTEALHEDWAATVGQMQHAVEGAMQSLLHRLPILALNSEDERYLEGVAQDLTLRMRELVQAGPDVGPVLDRLAQADLL